MWYNIFAEDVNIYSNDPYYKNEDMKKWTLIMQDM